MTRKVVLVLVIFLAIVLSSNLVDAGCCVGQTGCTRAFDASECPSTAPYDPLDRECEDVVEGGVYQCAVGVCCHDDPAFPHSMYRITCDLGFPGANFHELAGFQLNPTAFESQTNTLCQAVTPLPQCSFRSCEQANAQDCRCGLTNLNTTENPFCCEADNLIFSSLAACQLSSCAAASYVALQGIVYDSATNLPVVGATVRAGGKQTVTDADGFYRIPLLPSNSEGTVLVTKDIFSSATAYQLGTVDEVLDLFIELGALEVTAEDCDTPGDQDNDQFGGGNIPEGKIDACDADCGTVLQTVLPAFYQASEKEPNNMCNDQLDNDCDGLVDMDDDDCSVVLTSCGDGKVQFPNSDGQFEQCDMGNLLDNPGSISDDAVCSGLCNVTSCTCTYAPGCGNGIIDEPLEECDGIWNPVEERWDPPTSVQGPCPGQCRTPLDADPCSCPQGNVCGDGILQYPPEQCEYRDAAYIDGDRMKGMIDPSEVDTAPGIGCDTSAEIPCNPNCQCVLKPVCGNGILEAGEDCEGTFEPGYTGLLAPTDPFRLGPGKDNLQGYWVPETFKTNKFGCNLNICGGSTTELGEDRQWDVGSASLVDACACPTQCKESPPPPELLEAKATRFKREINIKWADECKETVNRYFVYRCKNGNKGGSCTIVSGELFPDVDHYQDTDLEEHTEYCYYVQGIYDTTTPGENMKESNLMCVTTGDEHCFTLKDTYGDLAEEFCGFAYGNTRSTCDEDNEIIEAPITDAQPFTDCSLADLDGDGEVDGPPEDMCIGPLADGKSRCIPSAVCDACSDAFGLFSFSRFHTTGLALKSSDFGKARGFSKDLSMAGLLSCNQLLGCFYDYSRISVDTFKPVTRNMTCYDYLSEAACDEDAKNLSICKWVNATEGYYHQVGFGVCRPTDIYQEDCGRCHDPLNGYFGKCGKETCGLYGHCYYDKDQLGRKYYALPYFDRDGDNMDYVCQHMFNISCEDYDTEADCVNSSSPYSSGAGLMSYGTVEVDVNGTLVFNKFNKNRGTNVQTGFSDDYFNYSKCQWKGEVRDGYGGVQEIIAPKCMRNADYSPPEFTVYEDSLDPTQNFNKSDYNKGADCPPLLPSNPRWIACRRDFRNPNTTIAYPDKVSATFVLEAFVDDDMSTYTISALPTTYSCIVPDGSAACYPNGTAESTVYANYVSWNNTYPSYETYNPDDGFQSGYYGLYYFSEDYAKNLEVVKKIDLFIDASPPKVDLVFSNESWELFEDIWRTNLSMDLNILEPDLPEETWDATCDITFFNEYHMELYPLLTVKDEFNRSWHRDYPYLEDGIYYLDYRCEDDVGNVAEDGIELIIDGDKSVTNPLPRGTLNYQDVELSVQTAKAADCKYLPSFDEIDAFNGTEPFGVAQYDSLMTQSFEFTGGTFHRQTLQLDNGWHRFYVKCRFPDELPEKRIVGSRADQIRFAVDVEPPATSMSTDTASYNDWYNGDVTVSLACQDQVMMDQVGLHWEYGCNDTKYCVGTDCGFFKTYTKPFTLDTSTNITFFSTDEGSNVEEVHTRQFLIDKVQPNLTLEVLDAGDFPAEFVKLDIPFKVRLSSDKPLISPAIGKPFVLFTSEPQKFNREITMMPTEDPAVWEGLLRLRNINDNRGFEGKGILTAVAADYHNVTGEVTIDFTVDTKPPTPPVLKPSIEDPDPENSEYIQEGYPLKFNNGTYFTNDRNLFLSGYTDELLDIVLAQSVEGLPKEFRYTQFETGEVFKDKAISGVSHKVKVEGDLTESVDNELFLGFGSAPQGSNPDLVGPRRTYRHYGEFYDLTSVIYIPGLLGADQYTEVTLYNPLEAPLSELAKNQQLFFYNRSVPSFYFGIPLDLEQYQHNLVMLFVYDIAGNIARYPPTPEVFDIYFDPDPPVLITSYPFPGTTSMTDLPIEMRILERTNASGIDESTINLTVNIDGADALMPAELSIESDDGSMTTFLIRVPSQHYADGEYKVSLYLEDWAGNPLNGNKTPYTWTFAVDSKAPPRPVFTLPDGNPGPYTESNTGQPTRWYTKEDTPPFTLEFMEDDPVTIVDIMFESSPTEGERAACTRKGDTNYFECVFNDNLGVPSGLAWEDYSLIVQAFKTLDDGSQSDVATYLEYYFTIDQEAPDFDMGFNHRIRDSFKLEINATVANEGHPLKGAFRVMDTDYPLAMTAFSVSDFGKMMYSFIWPVPALSKAQEGNHDLLISMSDYAGNVANESDEVFIDLTAPRIGNVSIDITRILMIGGQYYTRFANVTIRGSLLDDDVTALWVEPGTFNISTAQYNDRTFGKIDYVGGASRNFSISLQLRGEEGAEILNEMMIFLRDRAGHMNSRSINVIRDLKAPGIPRFCVSDTGKCPLSFGP